MNEILYLKRVLSEDLSALPKNIRKRILQAIEVRVPHYGLRLRRSLAGYWKLRVGDYRVVYSLSQERVTIWAIAHRSVVYDIVVKRIGPRRA